MGYCGDIIKEQVKKKFHLQNVLRQDPEFVGSLQIFQSKKLYELAKKTPCMEPWKVYFDVYYKQQPVPYQCLLRHLWLLSSALLLSKSIQFNFTVTPIW